MTTSHPRRLNPLGVLRLSIALVFVAGFGYLAHGQTSGFYLGVNAGANGSKFRFTEDLLELYPESGRLPGVNVGLETGFDVGHWSFSTGFEYVQRGSRYQSDVFELDDGRTAYTSARERLHTLSVPVLVGYSDYLAGGIGYRLAAGPSFNFGVAGHLDETTEYFGEEATAFQNYEVNFGSGVNDDYRGAQVHFRFAPSLFFDLARHHRLSLNAVWDLGAGDAYNPRYKAANDFFRDFRGSSINRTLALTVGYAYRIPLADRY